MSSCLLLINFLHPENGRAQRNCWRGDQKLDLLCLSPSARRCIPGLRGQLPHPPAQEPVMLIEPHIPAVLRTCYFSFSPLLSVSLLLIYHSAYFTPISTSVGGGYCLRLNPNLSHGWYYPRSLPLFLFQPLLPPFFYSSPGAARIKRFSFLFLNISRKETKRGWCTAATCLITSAATPPPVTFCSLAV